MKSIKIGLATLSFAFGAGGAAAQGFPERELTGVIMWGAGGATDVVARAVTPGAEAALGKKVVLQNKAGGAGAISTNFVMQQPSDGYTVLYGAENPQLHPILGTSEIDYSKFYPVNIIARGNVLLVTQADKPWKSFKDVMADIKANPGKIKQGSTGAGGLPFSVSAIVATVGKLPVISVPFEGEGPGVTAVLGGHVDYMWVGAGAAAEHVKAGRLKALNVFAEEAYEGVPPITNDLPTLAKYLPWGPFYGVFVKKDTPDAAKTRLVAAYKTAVSDPKFKELMVGRGNVMMNLSGAEAEAFLKKWQSVTAWTYQEVGAAKKNPAEIGIPKP